MDGEKLRGALAARERAKGDYLAAADRLAVEVAHALSEPGTTLQAVARELGVSRQAVAQMMGRAERRVDQGREHVPVSRTRNGEWPARVP